MTLTVRPVLNQQANINKFKQHQTQPAFKGATKVSLITGGVCAFLAANDYDYNRLPLSPFGNVCAIASIVLLLIIAPMCYFGKNERRTPNS